MNQKAERHRERGKRRKAEEHDETSCRGRKRKGANQVVPGPTLPPFLRSPLSATERDYTSQRPYGTAPLIEMGLRSCSGRRLPEKTSRSPGGIKRPHFSNEKDYRREIGNVKQDFSNRFLDKAVEGIAVSAKRAFSAIAHESCFLQMQGDFLRIFQRDRIP